MNVEAIIQKSEGEGEGGEGRLSTQRTFSPPLVDYPQEDTEWIRGIILSKWIIWIIWGVSLVG